MSVSANDLKNYFDLSPGIAICRSCKDEIKRNQSSTSGMRTHLRTKHQEVFNKLIVKKDKVHANYNNA